ncbi:MAG: aminoacyl-tRNA hydrolase [Candidatus Omnitrophota bacterium]|jgi:PTH1 family peptidyl-tRNA hydrolase
MKLIVGLGNPGDEYAGTRHNIGRRLMEFIAGEEKVKFALKKSQKAAIASVSWNGEALHLAYPLTYMNLSGEAIAAIVKHWKIAVDKDLLVVVDDVALSFGKFRLRSNGSSGGHKGLASIEEHLGSREYPRLRIGIGLREDKTTAKPAGSDEPLRDYVLSAFNIAEEKKMKELLEKGMEACRAWAVEPLPKAMSRVNAVAL